jgi:hypothetical protein
VAEVRKAVSFPLTVKFRMGWRDDPGIAVDMAKRFAFYFSANFRYGHALYSKIIKTGNMNEIGTILDRFFEQAPDIANSPNMNYF